MKRTPLKRNKPISKKPSPKQELENQKRRLLHWQLWNKQEGKCAKCGRMITYQNSELSHKEHIKMGGCKDNTKTTERNCEVLCANWMSGCHPNEEHGQRNIYNEQPSWIVAICLS